VKLERARIESTEPVARFAAIRLGLALAAIAAAAAASFPYDGRLTGALGGIAFPWSVGVLLLARRSPVAALSPLVAAGDLIVLASVEAIVPEIYGPVRFAALFFISAHAQFQGERVGLVLALAGIGLLVPIAALRPDPLEGEHLLLFYELLFSVLAVAAAVAVGAVRTAESTGRVRAWELTRRTMEAESKIRRKLAETIHDGPVQELASLDMMLAAASQAAAKGDGERAQEAIDEARAIAVRNVEALRDEIVSLGPYAFEELSFHTAVEDCVPTWQRRYGLGVELELEPMTLRLEVAGMLFHIAQEAVTNVGRHAQASKVRVALTRRGRMFELRVVDDGRGFGAVNPLAANEPGHIGLASMRERAEMLGGALEIESSASGTAIVVRAPLE
jgi:two-component system NarL family sensor kinase